MILVSFLTNLIGEISYQNYSYSPSNSCVFYKDKLDTMKRRAICPVVPETSEVGDTFGTIIVHCGTFGTVIIPYRRSRR